MDDEIKLGIGEQTITVIHVDFKDSDWRYAISYALGHILLPFLVVLSRLLKKEIHFGRYTKKECE